MDEALALRAAARKKTHTVGAFFSKLGGSKKKSAEFEEASDMYTRAANLFLGQREFAQAADCFAHAATYGSSVYTVAALHVEAAKAWRSANEPEFAAKAYADAIALFAKHGPMRRAALVCVDLAKLYEEQHQLEYALKSFERAVKLYENEHDAFNVAQTKLKAADVAARVDKFDSAIANYESAAEECASDTLTRFKLKQYFLKAGLCYLAAGDVIGLQTALQDKFTRWDRAFSGTLEFRLLNELLAALREHDIRRFEAALYAYDQKHQLQKWELEISLKVKKRFNQLPEEELL